LSHARPLHEHLIRYCRSWLVHNLLKFVRVYSDAMYRPVECVEIVGGAVETSPAQPAQKYLLINGNCGGPSKYCPCPLLKDGASPPVRARRLPN
jgi:hypothetical protein